jgi:hypothetical protein
MQQGLLSQSELEPEASVHSSELVVQVLCIRHAFVYRVFERCKAVPGCKDRF